MFKTTHFTFNNNTSFEVQQKGEKWIFQFPPIEQEDCTVKCSLKYLRFHVCVEYDDRTISSWVDLWGGKDGKEAAQDALWKAYVLWKRRCDGVQELTDLSNVECPKMVSRN